MPEKVVCRACGAEIEWPAPAAVAGSTTVTTQAPGSAAPRTEKPHEPSVLHEDPNSSAAILRRLFLTLGYLLAAGGLTACFMIGPGITGKASIFYWPLDNMGSALHFLDDQCLPGAILPLAFVVAAACVGVRFRALVLGVAIAVVAVAVFWGAAQLNKEAAWPSRPWFYNALTGAALLAILLGLVFSRQWILLGCVLPALVALAFAGRYLNQGQSRTSFDEWASFFAGTFHGLVIGLVAWLVSWIMNRHGASTLLGAFIGAFLGMFLADTPEFRAFLRAPELRQLALPGVSLYLEVSFALVLALITGLAGKRVVVRMPRLKRRRQVSGTY